MTVYLVWQRSVFIDDRDELQCIYDNEESAKEHVKRGDCYEIEEHDVLTKGERA